MFSAMFPTLLLLGLVTHAGEPDITTLSLTEGTWLNVDVHRRTVVFDLMGDIWRLPLTGGEAEALTTGRDWDRQPRFSPDGRQLAYVSDHGGSAQVWVMDRSGRQARPVTALDGAAAADPAWTPDGRALVVRHVAPDGSSTLWQHPLDAGPAVALTDPVAHPSAGEAVVNEQGMWFSSRTAPYAPNGDPIAGLWQLLWRSPDGGPARPFLAGPGSAARPALSPDGRRLAFVSRDREQTLLEVVDLTNGTRTVLADWLSRDQMEGRARQGTYPAIDWTADSRSVVLWARGGLWSVNLRGEQEAIPFQADGEWPRQQPPQPAAPLPDAVTARAVGGLAWGPDEQLAFTASGSLWLRAPDGTVERVAEHVGDLPAWRADGRALAWTTSPGTSSGALAVRTLGWRSQDEDLPLSGRLLNPAWSPDSRRLAVLRQVDSHDGAPWYEVLMLSRRLGRWSLRRVTVVDGYGPHSRPPQLRVQDGRIWYPADHPELGTVFMSVRDTGADPRIHLRLPGAEAIAAAPDLSRLAYRSGEDVFVVDLPQAADATDVSEMARLRADGGLGEGLAWLTGSDGLSWFEGPDLHVRRFSDAAETILRGITPAPVRARGDGVIALVHARVLTMISEGEIVEDATVVFEDGLIVSVAAGAPPPDGAEVIDCTGMTIMPGLIDVQAQAHDDRGGTRPASEWRYLAALGFGVTTLHDTTASTEASLPQAEKAAAGGMAGPTVLASGTPLAGADSAEAARLHVQRRKAAGAHSIKVAPGVPRAQQRWYAAACWDESIRCVAQADSTGHALSLLMDGYSLIEVAVPYTPIYADVLSLWSSSGAVAVPGLLQVPDGLPGEGFFFQKSNPLDDPQLLRSYPRRTLDQHAWRRPVLARDWSFQSSARDAAALRAEGVPLALGSGGAIQGLGVHWAMWALAGPGAMTPYAALQVATRDSAEALGLGAQIGTIEAGKRADLIVLTADPLEDIRRSTQIALVIHGGQLYEAPVAATGSPESQP